MFGCEWRKRPATIAPNKTALPSRRELLTLPRDYMRHEKHYSHMLGEALCCS
ncbi:hypothetical protein L0F63_005294 [Massospora cicadina]|nr:hypothetical protein L0F63_005294 [Massospora cicadina]